MDDRCFLLYESVWKNINFYVNKIGFNQTTYQTINKIKEFCLPKKTISFNQLWADRKTNNELHLLSKRIDLLPFGKSN